MTLGALLAFVCVVIGFVVAGDAKFLFDSGTWFLAAIPLALLGGPVIYVFKRGGATP